MKYFFDMKAELCLFLLTYIVSVGGLLLTEPCSEIIFDCIDPCTVTKCDAYPHATCKSNYCGGCTADFFVHFDWVNCTKAAPSN